MKEFGKVFDYLEDRFPGMTTNTPHWAMEKISNYLRVEVEGEEYLPKKGSGIVCPNHSGFSGLDAMIVNYQIGKLRGGNLAKVLTHKLWFANKKAEKKLARFGFIEASMKNGVKSLKDGNILLIFPEGEHGNFKSSREMYVLQAFRRGFVRMAIEAGAPIIPTLVIGAEETHLNAAKIKLPRMLRGFVMPLPINLLPLPAKWKIIFMEPIDLPYNPDQAQDSDLIHEIAEDIHDRMQARLNEEIKKRKTVFF